MVSHFLIVNSIYDVLFVITGTGNRARANESGRPMVDLDETLKSEPEASGSGLDSSDSHKAHKSGKKTPKKAAKKGGRRTRATTTLSKKAEPDTEGEGDVGPVTTTPSKKAASRPVTSTPSKKDAPPPSTAHAMWRRSLSNEYGSDSDNARAVKAAAAAEKLSDEDDDDDDVSLE